MRRVGEELLPPRQLRGGAGDADIVVVPAGVVEEPVAEHLGGRRFHRLAVVASPETALGVQRPECPLVPDHLVAEAGEERPGELGVRRVRLEAAHRRWRGAALRQRPGGFLARPRLAHGISEAVEGDLEAGFLQPLLDQQHLARLIHHQVQAGDALELQPRRPRRRRSCRLLHHRPFQFRLAQPTISNCGRRGPPRRLPGSARSHTAG